MVREARDRRCQLGPRWSRATRVGSERSLVLLQRRSQVFQDNVGVAACLAHAVGPCLVNRLCRRFPLLELLVVDRNNLMPGEIAELVDAGRLEISPWISKACRPIVDAVIV